MKNQSKFEVQVPDLVLYEDQLSTHCIDLPGQVWKYMNLASEIRREVDRCRSRLKSVSLNVADRVRDTPEMFGIEKLTEKALLQVVEAHEDVLSVEDEISDLNHKLGLANNAVAALDVMKRSLTLMVDLHKTGWFAEPRIDVEGREAVEKHETKTVRTRVKVKAPKGRTGKK
ncbi:MAG: hypothetical protein Unbinned3891contig1000_29 [Prokaryotic dsDNA virus sp.]|nr:MAG: hypothetical protein Unbinned3891contig1000_29 [Prokaryotic dsDNA virus sp.]|tara:strand:- start:5592 stop:6107 length:516 start_codon:yes stop_codon:yes gene_type:complete